MSVNQSGPLTSPTILSVDNEASQSNRKTLRDDAAKHKLNVPMYLCHEIGSWSQFRGGGHTTGSGSHLHPHHIFKLFIDISTKYFIGASFRSAARVQESVLKLALGANFTETALNRDFMVSVFKKKR